MTSTLIAVISIIFVLPMSLIIVGLASGGFRCDSRSARRTLRRAIVGQALVFLVTYGSLLFWAADAAYGQQHPQVDAAELASHTNASGGLGVGDGLGMLGVALATGLSVLGAGYAVGVVASAALGAIAEKPELFGRSLIFVGLAEGLAIYGLIVSILILGRLG